MSFFDQQVNLSQVEETSGDFSPIPPGEYTLEATGYKEKLSSNNNQMLELEFTIVGPNFGGRKIWENFVKGQPVAYGRLKSWIVATGLSGDQDLNQPLINSAMNRRFQGNVYMEAGSNGFSDKPKIKSFLKPQAAPAQQPVQPVQQEQPQFQQPPVQQAPVQQQQPVQQQPVQQPEQQPAGAAQFNAQWSK